MKSFFEFFFLTFWVAPKVLWFSFQEERKVARLFYHNDMFQTVDLFLHKLYRFKNPYRICKQYSSMHSYGETPLTVFHEMFQKGKLSSKDCFIDLGSGRGRGVFFASALWNCHSIGIERVPFFCEEAQKAAALLPKKTPQFFCQEIRSFDLTSGTFFYFYSLCIGEEELKLSILHLEKMQAGAKLVTVSFPITDYSTFFTLLSSWEATYPWGKTEMFLHLKKS